MYLFLDEEGCVTDRSRAVDVVYGFNEWVREDIKEYGTKYCCRDEGNRVKCRGMGGARMAHAYMSTCVDKDGKIFIVNKDNGLNIWVRFPLACFAEYKYPKYLDADRVRYMVDLIKKATRIGCGRHRHCVFNEKMEIVAFASGGDAGYDIVDKFMLMARYKAIDIGVML
jgi:hypothetical protein